MKGNRTITEAILPLIVPIPLSLLLLQNSLIRLVRLSFPVRALGVNQFYLTKQHRFFEGMSLIYKYTQKAEFFSFLNDTASPTFHLPLVLYI